VKLYLFDDSLTDDWHPFSLTRPTAELMFGTLLLRERLERFAGRPASATLTRSWLGAFQEEGAPRAVPRTADLEDGEMLLLSSRFVPAAGQRFEGRGEEPLILLAEEEVVGCYVPRGRAAPDVSWIEQPSGAPGDHEWTERTVDGGQIDAVWRLVAGNRGRLAADLAAEAAHGSRRSSLPDGVHVIGDDAVLLGDDVRVEPGVVFDTRHGPVRLADGVEVQAGARLEGPLYAGPRTRLLGGAYSCVSAGPECRLRGEIEESVVLGYANKAHDGFLGHAYIGRWVNLGALTTNSDLKNNYGPIRLGGPDGEIETGLLKLGCLLGDHVKTAIGTRINTGTTVGAGANLFGDAVPPKWVTPFAWGTEAASSAFDRERFLTTAARVLERRQVTFDDSTRDWLGACWDVAREEV
jgi:UDP-N-acetylglucosamine diphosphorylase/glucosamine-1-phosphate N-acetyltransferase